MSMRELFCPDPPAGLKKWRNFKYFFAINKTFPHLARKEQVICLQKLQAVVVTYLHMT